MDTSLHTILLTLVTKLILFKCEFNYLYEERNFKWIEDYWWFSHPFYQNKNNTFYCTDECCNEHRNDICYVALPEYNTRCYCDSFCLRSTRDIDCCPDYFVRCNDDRAHRGYFLLSDSHFPKANALMKEMSNSLYLQFPLLYKHLMHQYAEKTTASNGITSENNNIIRQNHSHANTSESSAVQLDKTEKPIEETSNIFVSNANVSTEIPKHVSFQYNQSTLTHFHTEKKTTTSIDPKFKNELNALSNQSVLAPIQKKDKHRRFELDIVPLETSEKRLTLSSQKLHLTTKILNHASVNDESSAQKTSTSVESHANTPLLAPGDSSLRDNVGGNRHPSDEQESFPSYTMDVYDKLDYYHFDTLLDQREPHRYCIYGNDIKIEEGDYIKRFCNRWLCCVTNASNTNGQDNYDWLYRPPDDNLKLIQVENNTCLMDHDLIGSIAKNKEIEWKANVYSKFESSTLEQGFQHFAWIGNDTNLNINMPYRYANDKTEVLSKMPYTYDSRLVKPNLVDVSDQGICGCSWIISALDTIADNFMTKTNATKSVKLSVQQVLSCGNYKSCNDSNLTSVWNYVREQGVVSNDCYPYSNAYSSEVNDCMLHITENSYVKLLKNETDGDLWKSLCPSLYDGTLYDSGSPNFVLSYLLSTPAHRVPADIDQIKYFIIKCGSVQATFKVYRSFFSYGRGIYTRIPELDDSSLFGYHSVRLLGWGKYNRSDGVTIDYWIAANSWGKEWGEDGYFRIRMTEGDIEKYVIATCHE